MKNHPSQPSTIVFTLQSIAQTHPVLQVCAFAIVIMMTVGCMYQGGGGGNALRTPPAWGPEQEATHPFRQWSRDILLWSIASDMEPARKAAAVMLTLRGAARELTRQIPPQAVVAGGLINGVQVDPLTYLMHALQERFGNLGEEVRVQAITELMSFQRKGNEPIDVLLVRFDSIRSRAADQGGAVVGVQGLAWILLRAIGITDQQLIQLLAPFNGLFPATEAELTQLKTSLRRMGHILERTPGNIREGLRSANTTQPNTAFLANADPWNEQENTSQWNQHEDYPTPDWPAQSAFNAASSSHPESTGAYAMFEDDDIDTDSNTSSGACSSVNADGQDPNHVAQSLFWAYKQAKHKWRKYMGKSTRAVRRYAKRFNRFRGKGKGKKGNSAFTVGKGKGKKGKHHITAMLAEMDDVEVQQALPAFRGSRSPGKGKGRKSNPRGPDGQIMRCFECGSTDHLAGSCPRRASSAASGSNTGTTFFARASDSNMPTSGPLSGLLVDSDIRPAYYVTPHAPPVTFATHADQDEPHTSTYHAFMMSGTGTDPWQTNDPWGSSTTQSWTFPTSEPRSYGPTTQSNQPSARPAWFPFMSRNRQVTVSEPAASFSSDPSRGPPPMSPISDHPLRPGYVPPRPSPLELRPPERHQSPDAGTPFFSPENPAQTFPWWPSDRVESSETTAAYHSISLPDRAGIIIDPGAYTNLIGENTARMFAKVAIENGHKPRQWKMKPMYVQGVGEGRQKCEWTVSIPIACKLSIGGKTVCLNYFEAPVVGGSGARLLALLGLRSLTSLSATLCMRENNEALYVPLPGGPVEDLHQCRKCPLAKAPSGHLIMTIDHWKELQHDSRADQNQTEPSKICFVMLSTPKIESHLCKCDIPQNGHKLDWKGEHPSIARQPRAKIQQQIASAAMKRLVHAHATSQMHRVHHDTPDCNNTHSDNARSSSRAFAASDACQMPSSPVMPHDGHLGEGTTAASSSGQVTQQTPDPIPCFPTEERIKQKDRLKKMKATGVKPKARKVHVEDHHDDCGTDHSALAPFIDLETETTQTLRQELYLSRAIDVMMDFECVAQSVHSYLAANMQVALNVLAPLSSKVDIVEICGGSARTSRICIRKHLKVGHNFDLVTNVDLNNPIDQQHVMQYFIDHKPLVAVMSPRCSPFGAHSNLNYQTNPSELEQPDALLPGIASPLVTIFHPSNDIDLTPFLTTTTDIVPHEPESVPQGSDAREFQPRASASKNRRTFKDADVGTEHPGDWSRFHVGRSLKTLSTGNNATQIRELRKLHLRWWHCGKESMKRVLTAAGLPKEILDKIPQVVDTCRECRQWTRPANETIPTLRMTTAFNEHVEVDLMFYREHVIFHLICCGTRWHAATVIQSKQEQELLTALNRTWVSIHGPMQQLISDGESGLTSERVQALLRRQGILVKVRAPGQHARFIERRGAILRVTLHCLDSQLMREGILSSMEDLLAEAVFAGNSLVHVGGVTPYQCIYGRTPAMLPPLPEETGAIADELAESADQKRCKIRTAALEAMIQATSLARTSRALRARSIAATETVYRKGDLVDYHRPASKDTSGWRGPVEVLEYKPEDGTVIVRLNGQPRPCRLQDVRHTLFAHVSFTIFVTMPTKEAISVIKRFIQELPPRKYVTLGLVYQEDGTACVSQASKTCGNVLEALNHLIESVWCFDECHMARIGKGCRSLPIVQNATHSTLLHWNNNAFTEPQVFIADDTKLQLSEIMGDDWYNTSFIQLLHNSDNPSGLCDSIDATAATHGQESSGMSVIPDAASERLSTIHEGSNEDQESDTPEALFHAFVSKHFNQPSDQEEEIALRELWTLYQDTVEMPINHSEVDEIPMTYVSPEDHYYQHDACNHPSSPPELDLGEPSITELLVLPNLSNCFGDAKELAEDEMYSIKMYNTVSRVEVIKRASDLLTKEEMIKHKPQVEAAILEELKIWNNYDCFKMVPRKGAVNIIDSRFVAKWKVTDPSKPYESRIIRMRMALRGFKEWCADALDTYAGTGSKISQRLLLSETACHPEWSFLSLDINKAFLQGVSYDELSKVTGQEERVVHFTLPPGSAQILRLIPGYEQYDERYHVLKCLKPGTGCKDAPRAFSLKLASVTRSEQVGLKPLSADPECEVKHKDGKLVLILVKHVDDLKIAGEEREVQLLLQALEKAFGKSDRNNNNFTCVGIRHHRSPDGTITLDQNEYISALKPIHHPDITGKPMDEPCTEPVMRLYWSLLGAVAYTLLTQHWIAIYIIALQRQTHKPQYQHIRKLNSLLKVLQKQKAVIVYPAMKCAQKIIAFSDASFCKESETKGYGVRGTVFLRVGLRNSEECCHLIDATSQSLKLVTRSTFSSETLAAVGTADTLIPLVISMIEIMFGPFTPDELRAFREGCKTPLKVILIIDAMNLFQAWTGTSLKLPSEKSLFPHIAWLRDVIRCTPTHCAWCDTRDMLADGMTKGSVQRDALLNAMTGTFRFEHPLHEHEFQVISTD
eukprot:Skav204682  [mRNA]  locus=scaffold1284:96116:106049:- [translate_table: standard]